MSTIKFTLKSKPSKNLEHSIVMLIIKDRKNTTISTGKTCRYDDWSFEAERIKVKREDYKIKNAFIEKYSTIAKKIIDDFELKSIPYSLQDIVKSIKKSGNTKSNSFIEFYKLILTELEINKSIGTYNSYKDALKQLLHFQGSKDLAFHEINGEFLVRLENYFISKGNNSTTISIRMRSYRAIFNKAIDREIISEDLYPFKKYSSPKVTKEAKKEYLSDNEIKYLEEYIPQNKNQQIAKDMFLLSYYCRGINFIDMLKLKRNNLTDNHLGYIRTKTGVFIDFQLIPQAEKILNKYIQLSTTCHLLPFTNYDNVDEIYYKNRTKKLLTPINKTLREEILPALKIQKKITFYCARHSFATKLKFKNISIDLIGQTLGHKDIKSTISYLNKLPSPKLDQMVADLF